MGTEFTNALTSTPLWRYAITKYPDHKTALLQWQDRYNVSVNDLLALSFGIEQGYSLPSCWWEKDPLSSVRALITKARSIRKQHADQHNYELAKHFELMLEGLDIQLLQQMLMPGNGQRSISQYEKAMGIKKEALASFIKTLVST